MSKRLETIKEIRREIQQRLNVYPGLIQRRKLAKKTANKRHILLRDLIPALEEMTDHEYLKMIERGQFKRKRKGAGRQQDLL